MRVGPLTPTGAPPAEPTANPSPASSLTRLAYRPKARDDTSSGLPTWRDLIGWIPLPSADRADGEPVDAAVGHLVRILHHPVLIAEHVQHRKPGTGQQQDVGADGRAAAVRSATDELSRCAATGERSRNSFACSLCRSWRHGERDGEGNP